MGAIDADAHVIETVQTWSYLEGDERRFTPQQPTSVSGFASLILPRSPPAQPSRNLLHHLRVFDLAVAVLN